MESDAIKRASTEQSGMRYELVPGDHHPAAGAQIKHTARIRTAGAGAETLSVCNLDRVQEQKPLKERNADIYHWKVCLVWPSFSSALGPPFWNSIPSLESIRLSNWKGLCCTTLGYYLTWVALCAQHALRHPNEMVHIPAGKRETEVVCVCVWVFVMFAQQPSSFLPPRCYPSVPSYSSPGNFSFFFGRLNVSSSFVDCGKTVCCPATVLLLFHQSLSLSAVCLYDKYIK